MLAKSGHETPFEKSLLHFLVQVDAASHIQILKHRIGVSVNAESARYKELREDKSMAPDDWPDGWQRELEAHTRNGQTLYHLALKELTPILGRKRAKESARFFLGYNNVTVMDITFNFRSWIHFYKLRSAEDAQKEIRDIAEKMKEEIKKTSKFDLSLEAFGL